MFPLTHFVCSLITSILLYPVFGVNAIYFFLGGFFIDVDHIFLLPFKLRYLYLKRHYSIGVADLKERNFGLYKNSLFSLHTVEIVIILIFLSFHNRIFFIILLGVLFHHLLDIYAEFFVLKEAVKYRNVSAVLWIMKRI